MIGIGESVNYMGHVWSVGAIMFTGGERYYLLSRQGGEVAMHPASLVEGSARPAKPRRRPAKQPAI